MFIFTSEFLNLRYQSKMISFGNCVILYLFSLFLVRKVRILARKGYTAFGNSNLWSLGNLFFYLMLLRIKLHSSGRNSHEYI